MGGNRALCESRDIQVLLIVYNSHSDEYVQFQQEMYFCRLHIEISDAQ